MVMMAMKKTVRSITWNAFNTIHVLDFVLQTEDNVDNKSHFFILTVTNTLCNKFIASAFLLYPMATFRDGLRNLCDANL